MNLEILRQNIVKGFNDIVNEHPNEAQLQSLVEERYYWDGYIRALFDTKYLNETEMLATHVLREYYGAKKKIANT